MKPENSEISRVTGAYPAQQYRGWKTKCNYVSRTQICTSTERDEPDLLFNVTISFYLKYRQGNIEVEI